jgi:hypothetical protein
MTWARGQYRESRQIDDTKPDDIIARPSFNGHDNIPSGAIEEADGKFYHMAGCESCNILRMFVRNSALSQTFRFVGHIKSLSFDYFQVAVSYTEVVRDLCSLSSRA